MPFTGGIFTKLFSWLTDPVRNEKIFNARLDDEFGGIATGLSNTICRDGTSTTTASIPFAQGLSCTGPAAFGATLAVTGGQAGFVFGAVSAPGIAFAGDLDTGIYNIAADNLGVAVGGGNALDITTSRVKVSYPTASTSTTSGALQVAGGLGVGGAINAGAKSTITVSAASAALELVQNNSGTSAECIRVQKPDETSGTVSNNANGFFRAGTSAASRFGIGAYDRTGSGGAKEIDFESANGFDFLFRANAADTLRLTATQNLVIGTGALSTTASDGYLYIPASAGAPTGAPTPYAGRVPLHCDSANNRLYVYIGGAWKSVTLT